MAEFFPDDDKKAEKAQKVIDCLVNESKGNSSLKVTYRKSSTPTDKGRWVSNVSGSMQAMPKRLRNTVYQVKQIRPRLG